MSGVVDAPTGLSPRLGRKRGGRKRTGDLWGGWGCDPGAFTCEPRHTERVVLHVAREQITTPGSRDARRRRGSPPRGPGVTTALSRGVPSALRSDRRRRPVTEGSFRRPDRVPAGRTSNECRSRGPTCGKCHRHPGSPVRSAAGESLLGPSSRESRRSVGCRNALRGVVPGRYSSGGNTARSRGSSTTAATPRDEARRVSKRGYPRRASRRTGRRCRPLAGLTGSETLLQPEWGARTSDVPFPATDSDARSRPSRRRGRSRSSAGRSARRPDRSGRWERATGRSRVDSSRKSRRASGRTPVRAVTVPFRRTIEPGCRGVACPSGS